MNEFTIGGKTYQYKPYSRKNDKLLKEQGPLIEQRLTSGEIEVWEYYDLLLKLISEPPHDFDTTGDDFDARGAELAILSFVPPSLKTYVLLQGLQLS